MSSIMSQKEENAFDEYEEEWLQLTSQIQRELGRLVQDVNDQKNHHSSHHHHSNNSAQRCILRKRLDRCRVVLVELTIEARYSSNSRAEKEDYLSRVKLYKIQVDSFEQHFSDIILSTELQHNDDDDDDDDDEAIINKDKGALSRNEEGPLPPREQKTPSTTSSGTSSSTKPPVVSYSAKREGMFKKSSNSNSNAILSTRLKLNKQNEALERARRSVSDIEDVAGDIAEELHRNRETLEASHDRVHEMSGLTNEANRTLTRMNKRWFT